MNAPMSRTRLGADPCMCVCVYACTYVCAYIHVCVCVRVRVCELVHVYVFMHICVHTCVCLQLIHEIAAATLAMDAPGEIHNQDSDLPLRKCHSAIQLLNNTRTTYSDVTQS